MDGKVSLFQSFEFFFELDNAIVLIVNEEGGESKPEIVCVGRFAKDYAGKVVANGVVDP